MVKTDEATIYGAGMSGLIAAANLARDGYGVTVHDSEPGYGGSRLYNPSTHVTPLDPVRTSEYIGIDITPVWNKSNREHGIIGTRPADVRREADAAVAFHDWKGSYFVDADHIGLGNVDGFIDASDFFTLDVADFTGKPAPARDIDLFIDKHRDLLGSHRIDGVPQAIQIDDARLRAIAGKYLFEQHRIDLGWRRGCFPGRA